MRPHAHRRSRARSRRRAHAYLAQLWRSLADLPPAINTLKAHVLWHLLDTARRRDAAVGPRARSRAYLAAAARTRATVARTWIERVRTRRASRSSARDLRGDHRACRPPATTRSSCATCCQRRAVDDAEQFAPWLESRVARRRDRDRARCSTARRDADRATLTLGPGARRRAARADRARVVPAQPDAVRRRRADRARRRRQARRRAGRQGVPHRSDRVLPAPPARGQHRPRSRRPRREPRAGAAVHRAGRAPRAPPHRAADVRAPRHLRDRSDRQRHVEPRRRPQGPAAPRDARSAPPGHVVTIVDEAGAPAPDARAWIGDREYTPDEQRRVRRAVLDGAGAARRCCCRAATSRPCATLEPRARDLPARDRPRSLDREALTAGTHRAARSRACALTVAGAPASLALLEQADVGRHAHRSPRRRDDEVAAARRSTTTTPRCSSGRSARTPRTSRSRCAARSRSAASSASRSSARRARVSDRDDPRQRTRSRRSTSRARAAAGCSRALGKTGEPRAQRPITVSLVAPLGADAAQRRARDRRARPRRARASCPASSGSPRRSAALTQRWLAGDVGARRDAARRRRAARSSSRCRRAARPPRCCGGCRSSSSAPACRSRHPHVEIEALAGAIAIRGLAAGEYELRAPGMHVAIVVVPERAREVAGCVITPGEIVELPRAAPVIAAIATRRRGSASRVRGGDGAHARPRDRDAVRAGARRARSRSGRDARAEPARRSRARRALRLGPRARRRVPLRPRAPQREAVPEPAARQAEPAAQPVVAPHDHDRRRRRRAPAARSPRRPRPRRRRRPTAAAGAASAAAATDEAFASYDFLARRRRSCSRTSCPTTHGVVRVPRAELGDATCGHDHRRRSGRDHRCAASQLARGAARAARPAAAARARSGAPRHAAQGDRAARAPASSS